MQVDLAAAAPQGRIVIVGTLAGGHVELPLFTLMSKRLAMHGTTLRGRSIEQKAEAVAAFVAEVGPLLDDGRVHPVVEQVLPLEDAVAAYDLLASDSTFGKVILRARLTAIRSADLDDDLPRGRARPRTGRCASSPMTQPTTASDRVEQREAADRFSPVGVIVAGRCR